MRQLPKRCSATAQNPGSMTSLSWVRRSSRSRARSPMPGGLRFLSPGFRGEVGVVLAARRGGRHAVPAIPGGGPLGTVSTS